MLEEIKAILVRKGIFEPDKDREPGFGDLKEDTSSTTSKEKTEDARVQDSGESKKGIIVKFFLKFVYSLDLKIKGGVMRFLLLKGENLNVSTTNIKDLFYGKIDNIEFLQEYEWFSVNWEDVNVDVSPSTNNEMIINLNSDQVTVSNTSFPNWLSIFEEVSLSFRIPLDKNLMKNLWNWCIGIECKRGLANMSMEYLLKAIRFFMILDTMLNVIKRTKKLLIKLHFLNDIINEEKERDTRKKNGLQSMYFENYKNLDIPRNITAKVYDYLTVNLTYPRHPLTSIMKIKNPLFEKVSLNSSRIEFEMLFNTMK